MELLATYGLTVAAALLASAVSGTAGFGGALLLLPAFTGLFGIDKAMPLLALAQLVGNASRAILGLHEIDWRVVRHFTAGAAPAAVVTTAALLSLKLPAAHRVVSSLVLIVALWEAARAFALLPQRGEFFVHCEKTKVNLIAAGAFVGLISGIAGTAGPLPNAIFLRLQFTPTAYVATDAVAMGIVHAAKLVVFGTNHIWNLPDYAATTSIVIAMVIGTWIGRKVLGKLGYAQYRRAVAIWLCIAALAMFLMPVD